MSPAAAMAAALFAVDPAGCGGLLLRAGCGPGRDAWQAYLYSLLPAGTPLRRLPTAVQDAELLGGLDLAATLGAGRAVHRAGLLAQAHGGVLVVPMAERLPAASAARLAAVMDQGTLKLERDGMTREWPARWGVLALDEGLAPDETAPPALTERMALQVPLGKEDEDHGPQRTDARHDIHDVERARLELAGVRCSDALIEALCAAALAMGIDSMRAPLQALWVARCAAALDGREDVNADDAGLAARLVLAPRATRLPPEPARQEAESAPPAPDQSTLQPQPQPEAEPQGSDADSPPPDESESTEALSEHLADQLLAAARAALPPGLLAALAVRRAVPGGGAGGRAGALQAGRNRGRAVGHRRGPVRGGARLNLVETLRAAAPWQRAREQQWQAERGGQPAPRVHVRRDDFHVHRLRQRSATTTVFVVDASGSSALHRLAEAKGAVELLLADCYVRRDRVALLAFRGKGTELLLPPTRSLPRAKRSLAGMVGGGGTPLASGLHAARHLVEQIRRRGETPVVVLLTDGRANVASDGAPGRARATEEALQAARMLQDEGVACLLLDTSPQPQETAQALAGAMGARYLPLPHGGSERLSAAVQQAAAHGD